MKTTGIKNQLIHYSELLDQIKARIRQGQTRAVLSANAEMICTYWDVGRMICDRQAQAGWGAGVLPRLARDLHNQLPEVKGFSVRNLKLMTQFYREYGDMPLIGQQAVAQLAKSAGTRKGQHPVAQIPWGHNVLLMQRVKNKRARFWYMQKAVEQGWSRDILALMIKSELHNQTIGLILCQDREKVLAEYALRSIKKPIGVSQYELTRALPKQLKSSLPTIEQIEAELSAKKGCKHSKTQEKFDRFRTSVCFNSMT